MTPQGDGAKYTSLLFTPRTTDSAKGLPDYRTPRAGGGDTRSGATRSPSPTPDFGRPSREGSAAFGGGGSFGGGGRAQQREGGLSRETSMGQQQDGGRLRSATAERSRLGQASSSAARAFSPTLGTPRGRRRSVTPSPPQRDAPPPPPPSASMMDSPAFGGGLLFVDPAAPAQADDDAYASIRRAAQQGGQAGAAGGADAAGDDTWVVVFGFEAADMECVMQEFQKCGDMVQFGNFGAVSRCNWIYIQYQNKYAAQRALQRDGEQLTPALMVGVKRLDSGHRAAIKEHLRRSGGAPVAGPVETPKAARQSSYLITAETSPTGGQAAMQALVMPRQSVGLKDKIMEYILGM